MTVGPRAAGLDPADLGRAMLRVAVGDYADEAAILLLLTFGHWLPQLHAADLIILDPGLDGGGPWARIRCPDLEPAVAAGLIVGSSGEMRVLRAATSITDSSPVDLGDLAAGLDRRVLTLLLAALAHAAGNDHRDVSFGAEVVPRPGDPATPAESRGPVWAPSESGDGARRSHLPYRTGEPFASAHNGTPGRLGAWDGSQPSDRGDSALPLATDGSGHRRFGGDERLDGVDRRGTIITRRSVFHA